MSKKIKRWGLAWCVGLLCMVLTSTSAWAQSNNEGLDGGEIAFLTSCTSALPFLGISTTAGIYIRKRKAWLRDEIKRLETISLLDTYIEENEPGVSMALALGAGGELDEIALIMGVEDRFDVTARRELRARRAVIMGESSEEGVSRGARLYVSILDIIGETSVAEVMR